jgi:hypothetical protein
MTKQQLHDILAACELTDALIENLWKAVEWGQTSNLNIDLLNRAPNQLKWAIQKLKEELNDSQ